MKQYWLFIITLFLLIGCQKDIDKTEIILPPFEGLFYNQRF